VLEPGIEKVEDYLGIDNLYESANTPLISFLNNSIKAKALFKKDKDYVVMNGEVLIVDEHTGRILMGRRYSEGIHQAIEAKEGVQVKAENQTLATVTLQNYFRLYTKLSGMTGTAETEAAEFMATYKLGVIPIPTNKPMVRVDNSDLVYKNEAIKFGQVVEDIVERHRTGQPILVGTTSVEKSELLSGKLKKLGVPHEVLNAKQHAREASIVAQAGRKGAVTVATNMAGRGTDIMLGGNAEFMAVADLAERGLDPADNAVEYEAAWPGALTKAVEAVAAEHDEVVELGGLYVLGTERHESRRIDNQLRGRSGRQGDPGESRFYLSLQDDLMRLFNSGLAESLMTRAGFPDDLPLESKLVTRGIQSAQSQVEARNFEIRKNVLKYDDVMSRQRTVIYDERRRVLEGEDLEEQIQHFSRDVLSAYITGATTGGRPEEWELDALWIALRGVYPISITPDEVVEQAGGATRLSAELIEAEVVSDAAHAYAEREGQIGGENMRQLERRVVLSVLDRKWREHLYEMDYLKEGIGLRAMAQRDPLIEYQREGFQLFGAMTDAIKEESVAYLYNLEVKVAEPDTDESPVTAQSAAQAALGAGAGAAGPRPGGAESAAPAVADTAPQPARRPTLVAKGIDGPERRAPLQYSAPSVDGDAAAVSPGPTAAGSVDDAGEGAASSNREERRKAAKQQRRRG
jgi:preprotein translocase subunit SecA